MQPNQQNRLEQEAYATELHQQEQQLSAAIATVQAQVEALWGHSFPGESDPRLQGLFWEACTAATLVLPESCDISGEALITPVQKVSLAAPDPGYVPASCETIDAATLRHLLKQHEWWVTSEGTCGEVFHLRNRQLAPGLGLRGAWLTHADLEGTDLSHLDLREANLIHANLRGARLVCTHLQHASLVLADLSDAWCAGARLDGANCGMAHMERIHLAQASARMANFQYAHLEGACFAGADLQQAFFIEAHLEKADLQNSLCMRTDLTGCFLHDALLAGCNARGACLKDVKGIHADALQAITFDSETRWPLDAILQIDKQR